MICSVLANLVMVTRPAVEIADLDAAAQWVGLPEYEGLDTPLKIIVSFENDNDRQDFARRLNITLTEKTKSIWWPPREQEDPSSLHFITEEASNG
jgi:hypothetical protein